MNLGKLFQMQRLLDAHIDNEHPIEDGEDRLAKKILALQVELGECANEWRGFKFWSNDQAPRTSLKCTGCNGLGYKEYFSGSFEKGNLQQEMDICENCDGMGIDEEINPLLEEYIDCLHFILSIGLEIVFDYKTNGSLIDRKTFKAKDVTNQFINIFVTITDLVIDNTKDLYIILFEHFISLGEMLGFTWEQVEHAYISKNKVNHERQEAGY